MLTLGTPCDDCNHALNWHIGETPGFAECSVKHCPCLKFQPSRFEPKTKEQKKLYDISLNFKSGNSVNISIDEVQLESFMSFMNSSSTFFVFVEEFKDKEIKIAVNKGEIEHIEYYECSY